MKHDDGQVSDPSSIVCIEFPVIKTSGSIPLSSLNMSKKFKEFINELEGDKLREIIFGG